MHAMTTTEIFLIAMTLIFTVPYLIWRLGRTEYYAPLVVVQTLPAFCSAPACSGRPIPSITISYSIRR